MNEANETELVREALAGNLAAFSVLVRRYQDLAYAVAVGVLSDFDLARDVVQEAFLCAFRELRKLKDPSRFAGWLRGIVRHTAFRALRELGRVRRLAESMAEPAGSVALAPSPIENAEESERRSTVRQALSRLSEANREAMSLFYLDDLSYRDIAGLLGVNETTVQGRLQRGRSQLRKELLKMVEYAYHEEGLPDSFADEIRRLLDIAAVRGQKHEQAVKRLVEIGEQAVDRLCEVVRKETRQPVRRAAAAALCRIGDARAVHPILRVLYAKEDWALEELFQTGQVLSLPGVREELMRILNEGTEADVFRTVQALSHVRNDPDVYTSLRAVVADPNRPPNDRYQALWAMTKVCPEKAESDLSKYLAVSDIGRTALACWYFALRDGTRIAIQTCLNVFGREAAHQIRAGAGLNILSHGPKGITTLEHVLATGTADERASAAYALARRKTDGVFEVLTTELLNGYQERKWSRMVAYALGRYFPERLLAWADKVGSVAHNHPALASVLARLQVAKGEEAAREAIRSGPPSARTAALRQLVRVQNEAALPQLRQCLREGHPRKLAQEAFRQMLRLRQAAIPTALDMLESEHWTERRAAYSLLRRWGELTEEQTARGLRDPHVAVRNAASWHPNHDKPHPKWGRPVRARQ